MNIAQILKNNIQNNPSQIAIGSTKKGQTFHYNFFDYGEEIKSYISAFISLGVEKGDRVAIMGSSSIQWHLTDISLMLMGAVTVPIYPNTIAGEVEELLTETHTKFFFCQDRHQLNHISDITDLVEKIILFEEEILTTDIPDNILFLSDLVSKFHRNHDITLDQIVEMTSPEDTATIVYTSGTTDISKAVVFTQRAITSFLENIAIFMKGKIGESDRSLSHLPLSHILGRCDSLLHLSLPSQVYFGNGTHSFMSDIKAVQPSYFITVPRILEKIRERVISLVKLKGSLFVKLFNANRAISKNYHYKLSIGLTPSVLEKKAYIASQKYFFSQIRDQLSPEIKFIVSGGAPLSRRLFYFFRDLGIPILEGYGLTESLGPCTFNPFENPVAQSAGVALPNTEIKIADDGEILVKTPSIFSEYLGKNYDDSEFDEDGFFKTGDIGHLNDNNYLFITDRKKDLIITSGGKNVAPQKIELMMKENPHISQFMVVGDREKYLAALVGIKKEDFQELIDDGILKSNISIEELSQRPGIVELISLEIEKTNKKLPQFEQIKHFRILPIDLTDNHLFMTPSGKIKKGQVFNKFHDLINSMYAKVAQDPR